MAACIKNHILVEFIVNKLCGEGWIRTLDTLYRGILTYQAIYPRELIN